MIFLYFISKIAVRKKTPTFFRIQKLLPNCKPSIQGHIFRSGLYFQAIKFNTGRSLVFSTRKFTNNFAPANITLQEVTGQGLRKKVRGIGRKSYNFVKNHTGPFQYTLLGYFDMVKSYLA